MLGFRCVRSSLVHLDALMLAVQGSNRQSQVTVQEVFALASSTAVLRPSNPTRFAHSAFTSSGSVTGH